MSWSISQTALTARCIKCNSDKFIVVVGVKTVSERGCFFFALSGADLKSGAG